jgi:alpha-aminoadipic semialdehyde synthase
VFSDQEFREAGAIVQEDLSEASLIIGVKRIPLSLINGGKNYLFFSHVIKAQPYNMDLLDHILETKARLFDYECITKDGKDSGVRLVAFGKFAGIAGMIDGLQGFGQRLLAEGFSTPFLNIPTSHMYQNLDQARYTVRNVGAQIAHGALPESLTPVVFAFTGTGNVSNGAREIFELLPHEYIKVSDLPSLASDVASGKKKGNKIYGVVLTAEQLVRRKDGSNLPFDKSHYYSQPELYESRFYDDVLPYVSFLANCMYWDRRFPRIITNEEIKKMRSTGNKNLRFVSDISCDPNGSVEFMTHCTEIQQPFFTYVPETGAEVVNVSKDGVSINSVEILPTELPRDASEHFGRALMPLLPPLLKSKGSVDHNDMNDVPAELRRACIASHGALLPKWNYISRLREQTTRKLPENTSGADEETTAVVQMTV